MFALVDCDHFYASCERVFRPDLWHKPVAVLSLNDGCVIARSPEVKALGVEMGAPYFQCEARLRAHHASIFSANFQLYGDLSRRVMFILRSLCPELEVYSIDEAFLSLKTLELSPHSCYGYARMIHERIWREVGIPVSVGIGSTMTLAKLATRFAKQSTSRVWIIEGEEERVRALQNTAAHQVWGIGSRWSLSLRRIGIDTAFDLTQAPEDRLKRYLNISSMRTVHELRGTPCLTIQTCAPPRKSLRYSRTFPRQLTERHLLEDALSAFAGHLGAHLRTHQRKAGVLHVWICAPEAPQKRRTQGSRIKSWRLSIPLNVPTAETSTLIEVALEATRTLCAQSLPHLQRWGVGWSKAGLSALDLRDLEQLDLPPFTPNPQRETLSTLEDTLNRRFGVGTARIGGLPHSTHKRTKPQPAWTPKQARRSPLYTTCWADLPILEIDRISQWIGNREP